MAGALLIFMALFYLPTILYIWISPCRKSNADILGMVLGETVAFYLCFGIGSALFGERVAAILSGTVWVTMCHYAWRNAKADIASYAKFKKKEKSR